MVLKKKEFLEFNQVFGELLSPLFLNINAHICYEMKDIGYLQALIHRCSLGRKWMRKN